MGPVVLVTGLVEPSTLGPHVEQVGWGVARQVARRLLEAGVPGPCGDPTDGSLLGEVVERAEQRGWVAYAVLAGLDAVALALLRLDGTHASYEGELVTDQAPPGTSAALLVRALHDARAGGATLLRVPRPAVDLSGWPRASAR